MINDRDLKKVYEKLDPKIFNHVIKKRFYNKKPLKEPRANLFENSRKLLENGYFNEAHILLQSTWNVGYYSKNQDDILKKLFRDKKFEGKIKHLVDELKGYTIKTVNFENTDVVNNIKKLYKIFYDKFNFTGASKAMALEIPYLFVMWDDLIVNIIFENKIKNKSIQIKDIDCPELENLHKLKKRISKEEKSKICKNKIKSNFKKEFKKELEFNSIHFEPKSKHEKEKDYYSELYVDFLKVMKYTFKNFRDLKIDKPEKYKYNKNSRPLAKKIDEFNYSVITMTLKKEK